MRSDPERADPEFRDFLLEITRPLNGQYPRPWMTRTSEPATARVFLVGKNQATAFPVEIVGSQEEFVDGLLDPVAGRRLYERARGGRPPSPSRLNIDAVVDRLAAHGVTDVLETNVACYSTPSSSDLRKPEHAGGRERGIAVFQALFDRLRPEVVITHGADVRKRLGRVLGVSLPEAPNAPGAAPSSARLSVSRRTGDHIVQFVVLPTLAPPAWNQWSAWAGEHLDEVAGHVASMLSRAD